MGKRILILGPTGVDKDIALKNLKLWSEKLISNNKIQIIDFEKEYIEKVSGGLYNYLDQMETAQRLYWEKAWKNFISTSCNENNKDIILSLHGVITRPTYGLRAPLLISAIKEFKPNIVITLIDDVYAMWYRTEKRSQELNYRGRPSLEQLLSARRSEIFLGDMLARNLSTDYEQIPHYVLAVRHPARILFKLLFGGQDTKRIYLSFPISEPRRLEKKSDLSGIQIINSFLKKISLFEKQNPNIVCFCPLTIDEFPISKLSKKDNNDVVTFAASLRWNVKDFYGKEEILLCNELQLPNEFNLLFNQIEDIQGMIPTDVRDRDYRLVKQSNNLIVFCPVFCNKISKGVDNEIQSAIIENIPVHIYQDPMHDTSNIAISYYKREKGSLGEKPRQDYITFHDSLDKILEIW